MVRQLTVTQAVLLTLFTGVMLAPHKEFLKAIETKLHRTVNPVEFTNDEFIKEVQDLFHDEWVHMCKVISDEGLIILR